MTEKKVKRIFEIRDEVIMPITKIVTRLAMVEDDKIREVSAGLICFDILYPFPRETIASILERTRGRALEMSEDSHKKQKKKEVLRKLKKWGYEKRTIKMLEKKLREGI